MNINETRSLDEGLSFNSRVPVRVSMNLSKRALVESINRCIPRFKTKQRRHGHCVEYWAKVQEFYKRRKVKSLGDWDAGIKPSPANKSTPTNQLGN